MKKTFEKAIIGGIEVENRIFRSATHGANAIDNKPSSETLAIYKELVQGDLGLVVFGYSVFSKSDHYGSNVLALREDTFDSFKEVTDMAHANGTKMILQVAYAGTQLFEAPNGPAFGPSECVDPVSGIPATVLSIAQIKEIVKEFGETALLSKKAGFDGIQLHGAHGYMLNKFMSSTFNKRTDEYGGDTIKNMKFIADILKEIKSVCGEDFPVWIKMNNSDFESENDDQGYTEKEFLIIGEELGRLGMDAIEVSGGTMGGFYSPLRNAKHVAYHLESAKKLSEVADTSVVLVGGLRNIDTVNEVLENTKIDAVSMSRALIREPNLITKWKNGDKTPAKCVACNGCFNFKGTQCFFTLSEEDKVGQREVMKMFQSRN